VLLGIPWVFRAVKRTQDRLERVPELERRVRRLERHQGIEGIDDDLGS
jgi:hypothetical protein